ncbi:MAG: hypothetical protein COA97_09455 [Flavobacteriales bacterium]|nr:MAG: hypothetical protein COA97_09455 [Flavobacteriales bacterium]
MFTSIISSCQTVSQEKNNTSEDLIKDVVNIQLQKDTVSYTYSWKSKYDYKASLINKIEPPKDYKRIASNKNSFANWLQHIPVKSDSTVYLYNGEEKYNQSAQFKVLDIDVGDKDLQQCADAVMRLRAEYLYASNQYNKIHFKYTNGINIPFSKWSSGYYPSLKNNKVIWTSSSNNKSYPSFKKYMTNIFMYAGTASLEKEMKSVLLSDIQAGDVLIKGGFPGHAVMVLSVVINPATKNKAFLLAQSYMPAQSIHILKNPKNKSISPWYSLNELKEAIETPEWTFYPNQLKRFEE